MRRITHQRAGAIAAVAVLVALTGLFGHSPATAAPLANAPSASQVRAGEWWLSEMGIQKAWSVTKGAGVTVGLLDSGIDPTHPDLQDALVSGTDVSGKGAANGEKPVDGDEHGTNMAGFIAGRGHDGVGMLGAAPEAKVMSASYNNSNGTMVARGLRYLVDHGAKVINMSFVGAGVTNADVAYAESHDVVLVAGTGNGLGNSPENPSTQFGVVSVSGVLKGLTDLASGSSYGPPELNNDLKWSSDASQGTAVAGPYSTTNDNLDMVSLTTVAKGTYAETSGTSNATAVVSGIVALIRAAHPSMNAANVVNLLIRTASLGKAGMVNDKVGFGVPDAYAAVTSTSVKSVCESPLGSQATKSVGFWPVLLNKSYKYKPACESSGSSSPTAPSSGASSTGGSVPTSAASSGSAASSSKGGSSGGVPVWVIVLIVVVVLGAIALVLVLRGRGKRGGPGGPPSSPPAGGGWGPPPGSGPYGGPPPQGPPPGGWQPGPPSQPGWQPGS